VGEMSRARSASLVLALLLLGVGIGTAIGLTRKSGTREVPPVARSQSGAHGWAFHRRVPQATLTAADGRPFPLRSLRGRIVVLAPSLTLCHEVCPMTTQALMLVRRSLPAQGMGKRVALVEATVDPWRDSPARLRAYDRLTGASLIQLTGSVAQMRRFWGFFGIGFRRVPQGKFPDTDWWTGRPETFDVEHVDGLFLIDAQGYERKFFAGPARLTGGRIDPALRRLLSADGLHNLAHPREGWTVTQVTQTVEKLLGEQPA
jgi:cytochrome oxidase Cu insertion factor (SCO1/SenC/PrrC family)